MKKSKVLPWILAGILVVALSACSKQGEEAVMTAWTAEADSTNAEAVKEPAEDTATETAEDTIEETACLTAEETVEPAAEEADGQEVSLVMVGDILLHTPVAQSALGEEGTYDFSAVFEHVEERIKAADVALVNQEVIIGGSLLGITGYPSFNAPFELGDALVNAGFDVVLHATNHALDKGRRGLENCLSFWAENYPETVVLGINGSKEAQESIYVYEENGIRIAILNYTYGTNGISMPETMPYAVNLLEEEKVVQDLQRAEEIADFVIVCPHWGTEYQRKPSAEQEKWVKLFAENGVDLVIGTHPHVIEPVEWYGEEEEGMLVYYSLGNFVNWTSDTGEGTADRMLGCMAEVTIGRDMDGEVEITKYNAEPLVCHLEQGQGGVTVYFLDEYSHELAEKNEIRKQDQNFSVEYCMELWGEVISQTLN